MNNQPQPTVRSGEHLPYLDDSNDHLFFQREFWNKIIAVARGVVATRDWRVSEQGILTDKAVVAGTGAGDIAGQWDPAQSYAAKTIVFFTPDGDFGRTFYSLQHVPAGIAPDTGAPYWNSFPSSPPGVWA